MNRISSKNSIPTVDLQHGMFARNEPLMVNYYKQMNLDNFPDKMLLFGDHWKREARFPIEDNSLISVGYPYFEEKKSKFNKDNNSKYITFLSQGKIGVELSKLAAELSSLLKGTKYKILYKTHPFEHNRWKHEYPWLINKDNIEVFDSNDEDIYNFFEQSVCIVGVYSTAIYEGASLNLLTFIYNSYSSNELKELYGNYENVNLVKSAKDIVNILNQKTNEQKFTENFNQLFKKNSIENINNFLDRELNR